MTTSIPLHNKISRSQTQALLLETFPLYNEFWSGEPWIAAAYIEAELYRREQVNHDLWLQGLYFSNAVNTALANAFWDHKGIKPDGYLKYPIAFTEREKAAEAERKRKEALDWFMQNQK